MAKITRKDLENYCQSYYGLRLEKCDRNSRGYVSGEWRTGWQLSGIFPGFGHQWRHYRSLRAIAKAVGYFKINDGG